MQLIPGDGPSVSDDGSEGSGAFNASFGGGLRGLPLFLGISGEFIHISDPTSHTDRKVVAVRAKRDSNRRSIRSLDVTGLVF